jgi:regulator of sirC expression with transglutaminase-like and TPR domain
MTPRQAFLACLEHGPDSLFEAALWIAAEHDAAVRPDQLMQRLGELQVEISTGLPSLPAAELAQPLLRGLNAAGFAQADDYPLRPGAALLDQVLQRKRGQPLALGLIGLELARRLGIPLQGVNFPGHFLLRVPGADHQLDPCGGRRLYPSDCRELLARQFGAKQTLSAEHLRVASPAGMLQRLSRNLRHLHGSHDDYLAALKDADRVLLIGPPEATDHIARAGLYLRLECPQAERFDLEHALLLSEDLLQRMQLTARLKGLPHPPGRSSIH